MTGKDWNNALRNQFIKEPNPRFVVGQWVKTAHNRAYRICHTPTYNPSLRVWEYLMPTGHLFAECDLQALKPEDL
jgi:hypothetical protein